MATSRRKKGTRAKTLSLDERAILILNEITPTTKSHGRVVSELIYCEQARREERARLLDEQRKAANGDGHAAD
jgi:hypothetical protein